MLENADKDVLDKAQLPVEFSMVSSMFGFSPSAIVLSCGKMYGCLIVERWCCREKKKLSYLILEENWKDPSYVHGIPVL